MKTWLAALALFSISIGCGAQEKPGAYARIVTISPHPGKDAEFTAGYERHIQWHKNNKDPWAWYGWTVVLGPRLGYFMDGTFGHPAQDFDNAIKPAEDVADNNANVAPYADFTSHGIYERLDHLGKGPVLPDASAFLFLNSYQVTAGEEARFERSVGNLQEPNFTVYRLKTGGDGSRYLLFRAGDHFSDTATIKEVKFERGIVESMTSEVFRFRPSMSHIP